MDMDGAHSPSSGSGSSADPASRLAADIVLDDRTKDMTVAQWWQDYMQQVEGRAQAMADDAVDALLVEHKNQREEIKNRQHERKLLREVKGSKTAKGKAAAAAAAAAAPNVDVRLTVVASPSDPGRVGASFLLCPRLAPGPGGMCRIGRSAGDEFQPPFGASLSFDQSVSHWHGKVTCLLGSQVFFTDLGSSNGSAINGESLERDVPYPLEDGDVLQIGGGLDLAVAIMEAGAAAPASAAAAAAGTCGTTAGAGAGGGTRSKAAVAMDVGGL